MRIGSNPMTKTSLTNKAFVHRVIVPVYIPNAEGYFEQSFEVLKLCLESLLNTVHEGTAITLINNASSEEVTNYLRTLTTQKKIDQLIENIENKGKVDPLISVMKGSFEPLVTLTDADVLFKHGWQQEVEKIFFAYPKVGMVSPLPIPAQLRYYSTWSWYFGFKKKCFVKKANRDLDAVQKFKESTSGFTSFSHIELDPLGLVCNGVETIIGAGHFCATYNRNILAYIPNGTSGNQFYGTEETFFDKPVDDAGMLRLATVKGWVYHIGNTIDPWMADVFKESIQVAHMPMEDASKYSFDKKGFLLNMPFTAKMWKKYINTSRAKRAAFKIAGIKSNASNC